MIAARAVKRSPALTESRLSVVPPMRFLMTAILVEFALQCEGAYRRLPWVAVQLVVAVGYVALAEAVSLSAQLPGERVDPGRLCLPAMWQAEASSLSRMIRPRFVLLDHLRWGSAWLVALGHIRNLLVEDYSPGGALKAAFYFVTGFGHAGVVVFFLLSGFLVGRKVRELQPGDERKYLLDRATRIFLVAWPAILLSLVVVAAIAWLRPLAPLFVRGGWSSALSRPLGTDLTPAPWLAVSALLNELSAPTPAVNGPLWSLAYEWTYYVAAAGAVSAMRRRGSWLSAWGLALVVLAALRVPELLWGGIVWTMGLAAGWISDREALRSRWALGLSGAAAITALVVWRLHPFADLLLALPISVLISHQAWRSWSGGDRMAHFLAGHSYTLYATHFPLAVLLAAMLAARLPYSSASVALVCFAMGFALLCAWALSRVTEANTAVVRQYVDQVLRPRSRTASGRTAPPCP